MFTLDHTNYARWLPVFINDLKKLPTEHPSIHEEFLKGHFTVTKSYKNFSSIAKDQAHEQNNKLVKIEGGVVDILDSNIALMKWMVAGPEMIRILRDFEEANNVRSEEVNHHEDTDTFERQFRKDLLSFRNTFEEMGSPFEEKDILINAVSKYIMNEHATKSVKVALITGEQQYADYVQNRLVLCKNSIYDPITRNKLALFREKNSVVTSKGKLKTISLKQDCKLFASLYVACQRREGSLESFFRHENHIYPPSISEYGKLRKGNKCDFLKCLESLEENDDAAPAVTAKVIDGAVLVQMSPPKDIQTFGEYSREFAQSIVKEIERSQLIRVDVVFDRYFPESLKSETRESRGSGSRVMVTATTPICKNWRMFLRVDENKDELFHFLASDLQKCHGTKKLVIATADDRVLCNKQLNTEHLAPSNHEEADTRIFLHVRNAAEANKEISIRTVDTDIVVIAVSLFQELNIDKLWIEFGTGRRKRWLPVYSYATKLGKNTCKGLRFWYAFIGCDTVSSFCNRGKKISWRIWKSYPGITDTFVRY